jgi:hypothetical protein
VDCVNHIKKTGLNSRRYKIVPIPNAAAKRFGICQGANVRNLQPARGQA